MKTAPRDTGLLNTIFLTSYKQLLETKTDLEEDSYIKLPVIYQSIDSHIPTKIKLVLSFKSRFL